MIAVPLWLQIVLGAAVVAAALADEISSARKATRAEDPGNG